MRSLALWGWLFFCYATVASEVSIIENVNIVSPHQDSIQKNMNVMMVDGRIKTISSHNFSSVVDVNVVDGTDMFLVPGMMDSHVHVSSIPGMGFGVDPVSRKHPELAELYFAQQPRSFLYYGVTQVLDPNPGLNWEKFTDSKKHPDYFRCEVITSNETFPLVEKTDKASKTIYKFLVEENTALNAPNSPERIVEQLHQSGAVCIKLYFEDGYGNNSEWPLLSDSTIERIRKAASKVGLPILAHANAFDMYQQAIKSEVDVIVHGMWNWGNLNKDTDVPEPIVRTLKELTEKGIGYMPTQRVIAGLGELMLENASSNPAFEKVVPSQLEEWYRTPEADWFKSDLRDGFDQLPDQRIADIFLLGLLPKGREVMKYLSDEGYPILLGSDFPGSPSHANQPGLTTFLEMKMMAQAGVPLTEVLAASTINNAKQFNLIDDYGTVEEGKIANLLLLSENPLQSVGAWNTIQSIVLHGVIIDRDEMAANRVDN